MGNRCRVIYCSPDTIQFAFGTNILCLVYWGADQVGFTSRRYKWVPACIYKTTNIRIILHLLQNKDCANNYYDQQFSIHCRAKSTFPLLGLDVIYIKTSKHIVPLCRQKEFVYSLQIHISWRLNASFLLSLQFYVFTCRINQSARSTCQSVSSLLASTNHVGLFLYHLHL